MNREHVLQSRKKFSNMRIWPEQPSEIRPERWLDNFQPAEREHATALLEAFIYFSKPLSEQLLISAVRSAARAHLVAGSTYSQQRAAWNDYWQTVLLTYPTGEVPNPTDSGQMYARWARQLLNINEERIVDPARALEIALGTGVDVLFIDDFVGSGEQFLNTWRRRVVIDGDIHSFASLWASGYAGRVHYAPSICTSYAMRRISSEAPQIAVCAAHVLPDEASLVDPNSMYIPARLARDMASVVLDATVRTGLSACPVGPFGFHNLGLGLAFDHSVPDASLPVFWYSGHNWQPLRSRR